MNSMQGRGVRTGTWLIGCLLVAGLAAGQPSERAQVGQEAPLFSLNSSTGSSYSLESLRGEQNALLIFFRGTW